MKNIIVISILVLISSLVLAQNKPSKRALMVSFYNVENLFDTIDDPHKNDNEFLPTSKKAWTMQRYNTKLEHLSEAISSMDSLQMPDVVGLAEVENKNVVDELIKTGKLAKMKYTSILIEGPDERGIDVGLFYNSKKLKAVYSRGIEVESEEFKNLKTRNILHVKLVIIKTKDTLNVFINHWPSRIGGEAESEPKRLVAARLLRSTIDSIYSTTANPNIIIMGDMNDEPFNKSLKEVVGAKNPDSVAITPNSLYNLAFKYSSLSQGSYYYSREKKWNMIDNVVISGNLLDSKKKMKVYKKSMFINNKEFLMHKEKSGIFTPSKTFGGEYYGGYSDHLGVFFFLNY